MNHENHEHAVISAALIADDKRLDALPHAFGRDFLRIEQAVYLAMRQLCADYDGGYWDYYHLSNNGFYMATQAAGEQVRIVTPNYFDQTVSADAAGIIACLYAFSMVANLRISGVEPTYRYHDLLAYTGGHPECAAIRAAID